MEKLYNISFGLTFFTQFLFGWAIFFILNYGVTSLDFNVLFSYTLLLISIFFMKKKLQIAINYPNVLFLTFNTLLIFTMLNPILNGDTAQITQNIKSTLHYYYIIFYIFLLYSELLKPKTFIYIIKGLIWILFIFDLYGIYQLFARALGLPFGWLEYSNTSIMSRLEIVGNIQQTTIGFGSFYRVNSIFVEPSVLASFNIFLFIFLVIPWIQHRSSFVKGNKLLILFVSVCLIALFLTYSMTGLASLLGVLLLVFFLEYFESYKFIFKIILIGIVIIIVSNLLMIELFGIDLLKLFFIRVENIFTLGSDEMGGESFTTRLNNTLATISIWAQNPLFGVGLGLLGYQKEFVALFSDTTIFSVLAECGIFNFIIFNALLYSLLFGSIKLYKIVRASNLVPVEEKKLIGIAPYIALFEIIRCSFTANILIYFILWMDLSFVFFVLNYYSHLLRNKTLIIGSKKD
ncbi:MAG: O-antigen ligase family protein [Ignavibacteria bacterium]|nr:O-antigen ligase family protein [Ignavibacteria bacterium]